MSVEALWTVKFNADDAGTVILETGRVFGGDAQYYYIGKFDTEGRTIRARLTVTHFHGYRGTTFGTTDKEFAVQLEGVIEGDQITGHLWREAAPGQRLPITMQRRVDLP